MNFATTEYWIVTRNYNNGSWSPQNTYLIWNISKERTGWLEWNFHWLDPVQGGTGLNAFEFFVEPEWIFQRNFSLLPLSVCGSCDNHFCCNDDYLCIECRE